jgi:hypothetical protein
MLNTQITSSLCSLQGSQPTEHTISLVGAGRSENNAASSSLVDPAQTHHHRERANRPSQQSEGGGGSSPVPSIASRYGVRLKGR